MENKKCFQCKKELFYKVDGKSNKCPFCGAINEPPVKPKASTMKSDTRKSDDDLVTIATVAAILSGSE